VSLLLLDCLIIFINIIKVLVDFGKLNWFWEVVRKHAIYVKRYLYFFFFVNFINDICAVRLIKKSNTTQE